MYQGGMVAKQEAEKRADAQLLGEKEVELQAEEEPSKVSSFKCLCNCLALLPQDLRLTALCACRLRSWPSCRRFTQQTLLHLPTRCGSVCTGIRCLRSAFYPCTAWPGLESSRELQIRSKVQHQAQTASDILLTHLVLSQIKQQELMARKKIVANPVQMDAIKRSLMEKAQVKAARKAAKAEAKAAKKAAKKAKKEKKAKKSQKAAASSSESDSSDSEEPP